MVIGKGTHKSFLFSLFLVNGREKAFPLAKLQQAASLNRKIFEAATKTFNEATNSTSYQWGDEEMELTLDEAAFAKELLDQVQEAAPSQFTVIQELKELLK